VRCNHSRHKLGASRARDSTYRALRHCTPLPSKSCTVCSARSTSSSRSTFSNRPRLSVTPVPHLGVEPNLVCRQNTSYLQLISCVLRSQTGAISTSRLQLSQINCCHRCNAFFDRPQLSITPAALYNFWWQGGRRQSLAIYHHRTLCRNATSPNARDSPGRPFSWSPMYLTTAVVL